MKKPLKILFPTDYSSASADAFLYALQMARKLNASIELLHVVYPQIGGGVDVPLILAGNTNEMVDVAYDIMRNFKKMGIAKAGEEYIVDVNITSNVEIGVPSSTIINTAQRNQIDLILMSSKGQNKSGLDKYMGSIAAEVVKDAKCPVFVIPEFSVFSESITLAYATNLDVADPFEIWQSMNMLNPLKPKVHVVHVNFGNDGMKEWGRMEEMKAFFKAKDIPNIYFHHIPGHDLEGSLNEFIEREKVNLLVMYQKERGFWNRLFHKSDTNKMATHTKIPLMVQKA